MSMSYQAETPRRMVLADLLKREGTKTYVEVGCKGGETVGHILEQVRYITAFTVDPWTKMPARAAAEGGESYDDWDFAAIEAEYEKNLGTHKHRCRHFRMTSLEAAKQCEGMSYGAVFIDAAHDFDSVVEDIRAWYPLVKNGGLLIGHDYNHRWPSVMKAVAHCFPLLRVGVLPDSLWMVVKSEDLVPA